MFIDSNNTKYYLSGDTYGDDSGTDYASSNIGLSSGGITLTSAEKAQLGAIFSNDKSLNFDFGTSSISVINSSETGALTAGFGYVNTDAFGGTLNATGASGEETPEYSVTASGGSAFGFVFAKGTSVLSSGVANLSNATIDLVGSGATITVSNSGDDSNSFGFVAGDLKKSTIKLGEITSQITGTGGDETSLIHGFIAGDVSKNSKIALLDVTAKTTCQATSGNVLAVELKEIRGCVETGNIVAIANSGDATGFSALAILGKVKLGDINVTTTTSGSAQGVVIGRHAEFDVPESPSANSAKISGHINVGDIVINSVGNGTGFFIRHDITNASQWKNNLPLPIVLSGKVELGKINIKSQNHAIGFLISNGNYASSINAPEITGTGTATANVTFGDDIAVVSTGTGTGVAIGISLGDFTGDPKADLASARSGSIVLKGDITATSANDYALGIHAGQLESLEVNTNISAETSKNNVNYYAYGIYTRGYTEGASNSDVTKDKNSVISITGGSIFATATSAATAASIIMDSTCDDVVNIDAGTTSTAWTNNDGTNDRAFTLIGVETLNVKRDTQLVAGSKRGTATVADKVATTNVDEDKTLSVYDTFFNGGSQKKIGKGTISIIRDDSSTGTGTLSKLEIAGGIFELIGSTKNAKTTLLFAEDSSNAQDIIKIGGGATLKISGENVALINVAQVAAYLDFTNEQAIYETNPHLNMTVDGGTVEVIGAESLYAAGLNVFIGNSGAIISVTNKEEESSRVVVSDIAATTSATTPNLTKTGNGKLEILYGFDLEKGTINVNGGTFEFNNSSVNTTPFTTSAKVKSIVVDGEDAVLDLKAYSYVTVHETNEAALTIKDGGTAKVDVLSRLVNSTWDTTASPVFNVAINGGTLEVYDGSKLASETNFTEDQVATLLNPHLAGVTTTVTNTATINVGEGITFDPGVVKTKTNDSTASITKIGDGTLRILYDFDFADGTINVNGGTFEFNNNGVKANPATSAKVKSIVVDGENTVLDLKAYSYVTVYETSEAALTIKNNGTAKVDVLSRLVNSTWDTTASPVFNVAINGGTLEVYNGESSDDTNILNPHLAGVTTTVTDTATINVGEGITFDPGVVKTEANNSTASITKIGEGTLRIQYGFDLGGGNIDVKNGTLAINPDTKDHPLTVNANVKLNANNLIIGEADDNKAQSITIGSICGSSESTTIINAGDSLIITKGSTYGGKITGGGNLTVASETLTLSNKDNNYSGTTTLNENVNLIISNGGTYSGKITGAGDLTVTSGTLTLSSTTNDYSGTTTLGGELSVTIDSALSANSNYVVGNNGKLSINDSAQTIKTLNGTDGEVNLGTTGNLTISNGGKFDGELTGGGTLTISGEELTLTGSYSKTAKFAVNTGTLLLDHSTSEESKNITFSNSLTGSGTLAVKLNALTDTFTLGTDTIDTGFSGTIEMKNGIFATSNFTQLTNVGLKLNSDSSTTIDENLSISKLTLNGGQINFVAAPVTPTAKLTVTDLVIGNDGGIIGVDQTLDIVTTNTPPSTQNIFDYWNDDANYQQQLIAVEGTITRDGIITPDSVASIEQSRNLVNGGVAKFNYNVSVDSDSSSAQKGIYLGYGLVEIESPADKTVTLDTTNATNPKLTAKLTGNGGFKFIGTGSTSQVEIGNSDSNYSGNTEIDNLKIKMLDDKAFGTVANLSLTNNAELDMNSKTASVAQLNGDNDTKINVGDLTVTNGGNFAGQLTGIDSNLTITGGTLALSNNANDYSGTTTLNGGNLSATVTNALSANSDYVVNGGKLSINNFAQTIKTLNGTGGEVNLGTGSLTISNGGAFSGKFAGSGNLTVDAGTLNLTQNYFATGGVTINSNGTLLLNPSTGNGTFNNLLTGSGKLAVGLSDTDKTFTLGAGAGTGFTGTLEMNKGIFATSGFSQLINVTLKLNDNSRIKIDSNLSVANLTLNGGQIEFAANPLTPTTKLTVANLNIANGGKIKIDNTANNINTSLSSTQNIFDYHSDPVNYQQQLVAVTNQITGSGTITLDPSANTGQERNLVGGGVAKFNYNVNVDSSSANKGIYLGYGLVEIDNQGNTVTLNTAGATNPKLTAKLTGNGGFKFIGTGITSLVEIGNSTSNYSGNTEIDNMKIKLTDNNAFGQTSNLLLTNNAKLDMDSHAVTVKQLDGSNTTTITNANLTITNGGNFGGQLTGNNNLTLTGGELTLTGNNSTATGTFNQTGGIMNLQNTWGGNYALGNSATLNLSNSSQIGGNINLAGIVDITNGKLNVVGDLNIAGGSVVKMTIDENKITANKITIDDNAQIILTAIPNGTINNVIVSTTPFTEEQITKLNSKFTLTDKLLVSLKPVYSADYKKMGFESSSQSTIAYTANSNFSGNQTQIAGLLDDCPDVQTILQSLDTREQLEGLVKSMLAPELAADARDLALNSPYVHVSNHLNNLSATPANNTPNTLFRGQSPHNNIATQSNHEFWFEGYYQSGKTNGDSNALGYKTSRGGMMVGVDKYFGDGLLTGLVFGYGNPRTYNSTGKIEADDYTFGVYAKLKIFGIYANTFLGYGSQNYQLRQNQINPTQHTKFNGDSTFASLELFKPIYLRNDMLVAPLVAIDFQKSWSDGFNTNNIVPLTVKKGEMDQTVLRLGVNSNYRNWRTRLQYGYQVAGDLYSTSRTSLTGGGNNRVLSGVNLGRHTFNAGFGGDFQIGNRTKLFADYDLDLGERTTNHTGQFGVVCNF
ncbi:MAG: autotransporter domain-containing protein [Planctomycetaceae bacterium]|nr:autotransporter domain-containing protein [Planctomycetaceae bacterium]